MASVQYAQVRKDELSVSMRLPAQEASHASAFHQSLRFLTHSSEQGGIFGLEGSAAAFLVAAAVRSGAPAMVWVLPDGETAARCAADVRFYLGRDEQSPYPLREEVMLYPSSDIVPYAFGGFDAEVWLGRMAALYRLAESGAPRVLCVGLDALMRKVLPRSLTRQASFTLSVGQEIDRESLLERLVAAGFTRSPLVEDTGDFSIRGFIIDIYPPLYPYPLRIEQMGDSIDSIRFFDPTNQRSREDITEIEICPVHMLIPDPASRQEGLDRLLQQCEDRGVEKRVRQSLMDDFRHGVRFPGAETYLPYFAPGLESLLDYVPRDATVLMPDGESVARVLEELQEEVFQGWESAAQDGLPVPSPEALYLSDSDFAQAREKFRTVTVAALEIEEPGLQRFRINCHSNSDIRPALLRAKGYDAGMAGLVKRLTEWRDDGIEVFLVSHTQGQAQRLLKLLDPYSLGLDFRGEGFEPSSLTEFPTPGIRVYVGALSAGFGMQEAGRVIITEEEIFGSRVRVPPRKRATGAFLASLTDLAEGDPVVHENYGIGIFRGLATKEFNGAANEVMVIEYAGGDLLYHPLDRLQVIQKYVSGSEEPPRIDRLGGKGWAKTKAKVKQSLREMAKELLHIYARRHVSTREAYPPPDEHQAAFEAAFEFEETPDQLRAIQDVMESLDSDIPMDRLVCGDVGYGKTEVALRAAFRVIMGGKQVAVLVPTTVLAQQHHDTFRRRYNGYPINVEVLSRFRTSNEQKETVQRLKQGKVDLVIGTHRLLQKDVVFRDLGLLVVDEEQRFGVAHKERIKKYKAHVDVLTLTATPIPRTLNLSLSGIRDLSIIETPPTNRHSIRTHVMKQSDEVIREALVREISRGGQAFFLHNRVQTIYRRAAVLQKLVPEGRVAVAHGQMMDRELEEVMLDFISGKCNILVCTSIIESGLDIPRANTIIIERADTFGLADLYQLRGRVGRSHVRAHAYLLTPPETLMTPDAVKRLAVIQEYSNLGQGFRIAMRDMEIRGAGNILGTSQSGHVAQVGYEMYLDLLEQAVQEMKGEPVPPRIDPEIRLQLEASLPAEYVPDAQQRMNLYKRLSRAGNNTEIDEIEDEMLDIYGKPQAQVSYLMQIMRIRLAMKELRILKLDFTGRDIVLSFDQQTPVNPHKLVAWAQQDPRVRLLSGDRLGYRAEETDPQLRIDVCTDLMKKVRDAVQENESSVSRANPAEMGFNVPTVRRRQSNRA